MTNYGMTQLGWTGRSATSPEASRIDQLALEREARQLRDESLARSLTAFGRAIRNLASSFSLWRQRRSTYAELMRLDDRMLADIGLHRGEVRAVAEMGELPSRVRDSLLELGQPEAASFIGRAANANRSYKAA
jgi:uncharacterized protein YjiS (DUF1127 family)